MGLFQYFKNIVKIKDAPIGLYAPPHRINYEQFQADDNIRLVDLLQLLKDSHIYSCIQSRKSGVLRLEYEILTDNKEQKELIDTTFQKLDLRNIINEMLDAVVFGFKPLELFYFVENDKVIIKDIIGKSPFDFTFNEYGKLVYQGSVMPEKKFLVLKHDSSYLNPNGVPILQKCYKPYIYKQGTIKLFGEFVQKYSMPFLKGQSNILLSEEDLKKFYEMLKDMQQGMAMVFPSDFSVDSLDFEKSGAKDLFLSFIDFCNSEISKAILSQTLTTEVGNVGSYAAGYVHSQIKQEVVDADKTMIEQAFNKLIQWLIDFNFSNPDYYPRFRLYEQDDIDMELAKRDAILKDMIQFTPSYFQKNYGLIPNEDFTIKSINTEFAEQPAFNPLNKLSEHAQKIINLCMLEIQKGSSYNEVLEHILDIYPNLNETEVEKYLETALTLSIQGGFIDAKK